MGVRGSRGGCTLKHAISTRPIQLINTWLGSDPGGGGGKDVL